MSNASEDQAVDEIMGVLMRKVGPERALAVLARLLANACQEHRDPPEALSILVMAAAEMMGGTAHLSVLRSHQEREH